MKHESRCSPSLSKANLGDVPWILQRTQETSHTPPGVSCLFPALSAFPFSRSLSQEGLVLPCVPQTLHSVIWFCPSTQLLRHSRRLLRTAEGETKGGHGDACCRECFSLLSRVPSTEPRLRSLRYQRCRAYGGFLAILGFLCLWGLLGESCMRGRRNARFRLPRFVLPFLVRRSRPRSCSRPARTSRRNSGTKPTSYESEMKFTCAKEAESLSHTRERHDTTYWPHQHGGGKGKALDGQTVTWEMRDTTVQLVEAGSCRVQL